MQTKEMGLGNKLVYCFYRFRTFMKIEQGSQDFNSCIVKIYLRMVMFTHKIHQQYSNFIFLWSGILAKRVL